MIEQPVPTRCRLADYVFSSQSSSPWCDFSSNFTALDGAPALGVTVTETPSSWRYQTGTATALAESSETKFIDGTFTWMLVLVQDETLAMTLPNFTTPGVPKPVPLILTLVPM